MIDKAKRKRVLQLLGGRPTDRAQAIELLVALDDPDLWAEAVAGLRTREIVGRRQVALEDLPLLAAAPAELPEVVALRAQTRTMWLSTEVPEAVRCLDHLEELHVTVEFGGSPPRAEPSLDRLAGLPVRDLALQGAALGDAAVLAKMPLRSLKLSNTTFTSLPVLPDLERLSGYLPDATTLGAGLPSLRRLELRAVALRTLSALESAGRLEDVELSSAPALADLAPLGAAIAAGAPLRRLVLGDAAAVDDLSPLAGATSLEHLDLSGSRVADLGPVRRLGALRHLGVRGAPVVDLRPLVGLRSLASLDLRGCAGVVDVGPLLGLTSLRAVALEGTGVRPADLPPELLPYATWAAAPALAALADRPRHPGDARPTA